MITLVTSVCGVDWAELAALIERAGLGAREVDVVRRAFTGSYAVGFLYREGRLIAAVRAISDGATSSAIFDLVVDPAHQRLGHGRRLLEDLLARLPVRSVLLVSVPEQVGFYQKEGFHRLRTAMLKHTDLSYWHARGYLAE